MTEPPLFAIDPDDQTRYLIPYPLGQGIITVSGGTAPYTYTVQLLEQTAGYDVKPWYPCGPTLLDGEPLHGTEGVLNGNPGNPIAGCATTSPWDLVPATHYGGYSTGEPYDNNGEVIPGVTELSIGLTAAYDATFGVTAWAGGGYLVKYTLTAHDSAGNSVTTPTMRYFVAGF